MLKLVTVKLEGLVCPYSKCGQMFERPVMVTDYSKLPRETYYACPHCMLRLEIQIENGKGNGLGGVHVKALDDDGLLSSLEIRDRNGGLGEPVSSPQATRPSKSCRHFLGYLRGLPKGTGIPDECSVCPNIMQCYIKRE